MSEIVLTNNTTTTTTNHYDYSNGSTAMMMNINPGLVQKDTSSSPPGTNFIDNTTLNHQHYSTYSAYAFQSMPTLGYAPVPPPAAVANYNNNPMYFSNERHPNSPPESISSSSSSPPTPSPPPTTTTTVVNSNNMTYSNNPIVTSTSSAESSNNELITPLIASNNSSKSNNNRFNNPTTARVKDMITRANSVPMEFYHTEFLEYSKETYEKKMESKQRNNKRKRGPSKDEDEQQHHTISQFAINKKQKINNAVCEQESDEEDDESEDINNKLAVNDNVSSSAEIRRQIHIQSEQKRRAQIKDGFDELRKHLPGCNNKKMSKAALLTRTVQQLQHLKGMQNELLSEVERLLQENEALKKFQHGVLQRQAMEKMYTF